MLIDQNIRLFANLLDAAWKITGLLIANREYNSDEDSRNDWLQANWELLVERKVLPLGQYLEVYGAGADFNGASSRITDMEATATHRVYCIIENGEDLLNSQRVENSRFAFEELVGFENGFYKLAPPFEYVLTRDGNEERVFSLNDVKFELTKIE